MSAQRKQLEGQILMDQGKYREAIPLIVKANDEYIEYNLNPPGMATWASAHIANCYYQLKDYQPAINYINLMS